MRVEIGAERRQAAEEGQVHWLGCSSESHAFFHFTAVRNHNTARQSRAGVKRSKRTARDKRKERKQAPMRSR